MIAGALSLSEPGRSQRILVCDDERHIARLIQVNMERQGHVVAMSHDGDEAIKRLSTENFDVAILDSEMPLKSGYEVLVWIRDNEAISNLKVVLHIPDDESIEDWEAMPYQPDLYVKRGRFRFRDLFRK